MSLSLTATAIIFGALGSAIIFADWLLSPKARASIKTATAEWWLRIEKFRWQGLLAEDARRSLSYIVKVFGNKPISIRFVSLSMAASVTLTTIAVLLLAIWLDPIEGNLEYVLSVLLPIGAIADWISLSITVNFLSMMMLTTRIWGWLFLATMDLLAVFFIYLLLALPIAIALETNADIPRDIDQQSMGNLDNNWEHVPLTPENEAILAKVEPTNDFLIYASLVALMGALCPSLLHITLGTSLAIAKIGRPILQPATALLLARIYEDERSVLKLVGFALMAIGAFLKGLDEFLKALS